MVWSVIFLVDLGCADDDDDAGFEERVRSKPVFDE